MTDSPKTISKNAKMSKERAKKCLISFTLDNATKQQSSNKKEIVLHLLNNALKQN